MKSVIIKRLSYWSMLGILSLTAMVLAGDKPDSHKPEDQGSSPEKNALLGTWNMTLTFGDGSFGTVRELLTATPGRMAGEGAVVNSSELSLTPPNPTLPTQGSWEFKGKRTFIASYRGYSYTQDLAPAGTVGFRHALTLSPDQESFTGHATFEFKDLDGNLIASEQVQTRGVRQHAEAP